MERIDAPATRRGTTRTAVAALVAIAASLALAAPALAGIKQEMAIFNTCPIENPKVIQCIYSTTTSGEFHLGGKTVPINKTVILQGGINGETDEVVPPTSGEELSRTPLELPGGLVGIELLPPLTSVTATAETAGTVFADVQALGEEKGTAVAMPLKVKLDNPLLGATCYVGSAGDPIALNLTTGTTSPPPPNQPITGSKGTLRVSTDGKIDHIEGSSLVDNSFAAPGANGCDEPLSLVIDPGVDLAAGLPSRAGTNTAILNGAFAAAQSNVVRAERPLPEIGRCVKAPAEKVERTTVYHGLYTEGGCLYESPQLAGKYNWEAGPGPDPKFTTEGKLLTLETTGGTKIQCTESAGSGEYTGTKTAKLGLTATGCHRYHTTTPCTSSGAAPGTIAFAPLSAQLGFVKDEAIPGGGATVVTGWDLKGSPSVASAGCGAGLESISFSGSVIAPVSADDKMVASYVLKLVQKAGLQAPESFEEEPKDVLTASLFGGTEQAGLATAEKVVNGEKLEIKGLSE